MHIALALGVFSIGGMGVASAHGPGSRSRSDRDRSGPPSSEQMAERLESGIDRLLGQVEATAEQKQQVTAILTAAVEDLRGLREEKRDRREEMRAAIVNLDRAKVESLRQENLTAADRASKRFTDALLEAGAVLSPEQRAELAELAAERRERWGGGRGGRPGRGMGFFGH